MKKSSKHNSFSPETQFMFLEDNYWESWGSGKNNANCLHHIFGRGKEEGCEKSPFNAAPLNNFDEHLPYHGHWMTREGQKFLFEKTVAFLSEKEYTLTEDDNQFLEKYGGDINRLGIKL